jgi:histidinol phosphatase-like PHP family hydrolase
LSPVIDPVLMRQGGMMHKLEMLTVASRNGRMKKKMTRTTRTIAAPQTRYADVNAVVGGYLRDLAFAQSSEQKMFGYKRAAAAIFALDVPITDLIGPGGALARIPGIGPGSTRVIREILDAGKSPTVEHAIDSSDRRADIERRRQLRRHFLSRAEVRRVLSDPTLAGPALQQYRGDLQMHSEWSDGTPTVLEIAMACLERGYHYAAVTDHSYGLKIAGGMSMADAARQRKAIDEVNRRRRTFRLLQGIEANIDKAGQLDLSDDEAAVFDVVLAAPHSRLRKDEDQTERMLAAVAHPAVRILAHPRGRITGSRAGVIANWDAVFAAAATRAVAIEIDGDPARQDLDYTLAARASDAGCVFALDSDAHTTAQLAYAETAVAHARLAGIAADRIVNCWPLDRVLAWLAKPSIERIAQSKRIEPRP